MELFLRYAVAYSIVTLAVQLSRVLAYIAAFLMTAGPDRETTYKFAVVMAVIMMFFLCKSRAIASLLDRFERKMSRSLAGFALTASIVVNILLQYVFETEQDFVFRTILLSCVVLAYGFIAAMAVAWMVAETRIHARDFATEKWLHQYRHLIEYAEKIVMEYRAGIELDEETCEAVLELGRKLRIFDARRSSVRRLPSTGLRPCDSLVRKKAELCREQGIQFHMTVRENLRVCMAQTGIKAMEVQQILGNLLQNAVEAVVPGGLVEVVLSMDGPIYQLEVSDNGAPIARHVLERWGEEGLTTKKNGHGFGIHEILLALDRVSASFYVYQPREGGERKCLCIRFDGLNQIVIMDKRIEKSELGVR